MKMKTHVEAIAAALAAISNARAPIAAALAALYAIDDGCDSDEIGAIDEARDCAMDALHAIDDARDDIEDIKATLTRTDTFEAVIAKASLARAAIDDANKATRSALDALY